MRVGRRWTLREATDTAGDVEAAGMNIRALLSGRHQRAYGTPGGTMSVDAEPGPGRQFSSPYSLGLSFGLALFASILLWAGLIGLVVAVI